MVHLEFVDDVAGGGDLKKKKRPIFAEAIYYASLSPADSTHRSDSRVRSHVRLPVAECRPAGSRWGPVGRFATRRPPCCFDPGGFDSWYTEFSSWRFVSEDFCRENKWCCC